MGKAMNIPVGEYTSPVGFSAREDTEVAKIAQMMQEMGIRHVPIVKDNRPVGIVSARDLPAAGEAEENILAREIMTAHPYCVHNETNIDEVAFEMSRRKIGSALVLDENENLDGIFTSIDALNALIEIVRGDIE